MTEKENIKTPPDKQDFSDKQFIHALIAAAGIGILTFVFISPFVKTHPPTKMIPATIAFIVFTIALYRPWKKP